MLAWTVAVLWYNSGCEAAFGVSAHSTVFMVFCGIRFIVFSVGSSFESAKPCRAAIVGRTAKATPGYIMKKLHERVSILLKLNRHEFM